MNCFRINQLLLNNTPIEEIDELARARRLINHERVRLGLVDERVRRGHPIEAHLQNPAPEFLAEERILRALEQRWIRQAEDRARRRRETIPSNRW